MSIDQNIKQSNDTVLRASSTPQFSISVDSCVDRFHSFLVVNDVHCIRLKRITNDMESADLYDSDAEFDAFYSELKNGALPTTSQLNPNEVSEHFANIFARQSTGALIHLSLSSGLSNTYDNCVLAAKEIERETGRKAYVFDTLSASLGIAMLLDRLIELRNEGATAQDALKELEFMRDRQQVWASVGNLFHLKRGGRISGIKATIGSILNVRPILIINRQGKLVIQSTVKGAKKSLAFLADKVEEFGTSVKIPDNRTDEALENLEDLAYNENRNKKSRIYVMHSSAPKECHFLRDLLKKRFPQCTIVEGMIGAIIGTHVGSGTVAVIFEGAHRLDI